MFISDYKKYYFALGAKAMCGATLGVNVNAKTSR